MTWAKKRTPEQRARILRSDATQAIEGLIEFARKFDRFGDHESAKKARTIAHRVAMMRETIPDSVPSAAELQLVAGVKDLPPQDRITFRCEFREKRGRWFAWCPIAPGVQGWGRKAATAVGIAEAALDKYLDEQIAKKGGTT